MAIRVQTGGGGKDFELVPAGAHFAVCNIVAYLGLQKVEFDGKAKLQPKVWLGFQIPDIQHEYEKDGKKLSGPAVIGRKFTLNIGDQSNLGPFLTNWRGKPFTDDEVNSEDPSKRFDIEKLAGKVCQLGVVHEKGKNGKTYANITSAGQLMQETKDAIASGKRSATPHGDVLVYNADEPDPNVYAKLPKFLREQIDSRVIQEQGIDQSPKQPHEDYNDEIPF